jgi:hypothetical protein
MWPRSRRGRRRCREALPDTSCPDRSAVTSARGWRGQPVTASWENEQREASGLRAGHIREAQQEHAHLDLAGAGSLPVT